MKDLQLSDWPDEIVQLFPLVHLYALLVFQLYKAWPQIADNP